jgi:cell division protein FtsN
VKNAWLLWIFIIGVIVTIFVSFNYEGGRNLAPLSEIFPDEDKKQNVEYEFVDSDMNNVKTVEKHYDTTAHDEKMIHSKDVSKKDISPTINKKKLTFKNGSTSSSTVGEFKTNVTKIKIPERLKKEQASANTTVKEVVKTRAKAAYTIQVASFKKQERANQKLEVLLKGGYEAYVKIRDLKDKGIWYRVCVGNFVTKKEVTEYHLKFKKKHKDSFIVSLK